MARLFILLLMTTVAGAALPAHSGPPVPPQATLTATNAPLPPLIGPSPIATFRSLLAMKPLQRKTALGAKGPRTREVLQAKLKEYDAMPPEAREERLRALELRWYLLPFMTSEPSQRGPRMASLPEAERKLVESRLAEWDRLPKELQRKVLENESVIRRFFRTDADTANAMTNLVTLPAAERAQLEKDQARWQAMPTDEQQRILAQFERVFALKPREQTRVLNEMTDAERRQMQRTLTNYVRLSKPQRDACLRGFQKFATLTAEEREEFLANAQLWEKLSPKDRQLWRDLVARLQPQPPLPPGLRRTSPPLPPGATPKLLVPKAPPPAPKTVTTN